MKFIPREIEGNVNVSSTRPLAELAWLLGGLLLVVVALYLLLGLATDLAVAKIPPTFESWLGERALAAYPSASDPALDARLQKLLAATPADSPLRRYHFSVRLEESETVNAVALPGGNIVVFSGLLAKVRSENELAMILAHELGHYAHRDHLRGLGRGLGLAVAAQLLLGANNSATTMISDLTLPLGARYSQEQEAAADDFGVDLTVAHFGHAGGTDDFFARLAGEAGARLPYVLASHPHPEARIARIRDRIAQHGYPVAATLPLTLPLQP